MKYLFLLLLIPATAQAALEEWSCHGLADFYGYVAIDRDRGIPLSERLEMTANSIVRADMMTTEDGAVALLSVVQWVYGTKATPAQHRAAALQRCLNGQRTRPGVNG